MRERALSKVRRQPPSSRCGPDRREACGEQQRLATVFHFEGTSATKMEVDGSSDTCPMLDLFGDRAPSLSATRRASATRGPGSVTGRPMGKMLAVAARRAIPSYREG